MVRAKNQSSGEREKELAQRQKFGGQGYVLGCALLSIPRVPSTWGAFTWAWGVIDQCQHSKEEQHVIDAGLEVLMCHFSGGVGEPLAPGGESGLGGTSSVN